MVKEIKEKAVEEAISAYVKFLNAKGVEAPLVTLRTQYAKALASHIKATPDRAAYGKAVQATLNKVDTIDRQQQLNFAREFYPFLVEDLKSIARLSQTYGFDLTSTKFKKLPTVMDWESIDSMATEPLDVEEEDLLSAYAVSLKKQNKLSDKMIDENVKLVKICLLILRDVPIKNNNGYRMAIDVILPLFKVEETKLQFLEAVREFFYFWIAKVDPGFLNE